MRVGCSNDALLAKTMQALLAAEIIKRSAVTVDASDVINPFTLRDPLESIVCYSHIFQNNLGIKQKFTKYLKESCCLISL